MKTLQKITAGIGIIFLLPIFLWFIFGAGIPVTRDYISYIFLEIESPSDRSHHLYMTDAQNVSLMKKALPPEEFEIWKKNWDLRIRTDEWKNEHSNEVKKIESDYVGWKKKHEEMRKSDFPAYRKKYGPLFGDFDPVIDQGDE